MHKQEVNAFFVENRHFSVFWLAVFEKRIKSKQIVQTMLFASHVNNKKKMVAPLI